MGIILGLLIFTNIVALGLSNNGLREQIQDNLLVTHDNFDFTPSRDAIADGSGGLYITEEDSGQCNVHRLDTNVIDIVGTLDGHCDRLLIAADDKVFFSNLHGSSEYNDDASVLNYTWHVTGYLDQNLIEYYPSILFPVQGNDTRADLFENHIYYLEDSIFMPGYIMKSDMIDIFVWKFNLDDHESSLVFSISFTTNIEELGYYYQSPYGTIFSTGERLYYIDINPEQISFNILTEENQTSYMVQDEITTQKVTSESSGDKYNCFISLFCNVFEIDNQSMYFELDNSTGIITRSYGEKVDTFSVKEGHYFFSMADVNLDNVVSFLTSTSIYGAVDQETSDIIYSTYVHEGES